MKTYQMVDRLPEEARPRHCADTDIPRQNLAKFEIGVITELGNVQKHIIRSLRDRVRNPQIIQSLQEQITF